MSDRDRMLALLKERGATGVTTFELRRSGVSGNPSQRKAELEERGHRIAVEPYTEGRRRGRRYILISEHQTGGSKPGERTPARSSGASPAAADLAFEDQPRVVKGRAMEGRTELVLDFVDRAPNGGARFIRRTQCPPEDIAALQTVDEALAELPEAA